MITNNLNLPQPFVDAATSDYKPTEGRYSVTRVLGSPCEAVLLRRHGHEIDGDVADNLWAILGSAIHKVLEESSETESQIKENWISVPVFERNGIEYTISGIFDLYDGDTKTVTDWKSTSLWKIKFANFDDWHDQLLLYGWMLRQIGFEVEHGEIVAMIRDHNKREARRDPEYPQHPVVKLSWDFSDDDMERAGRIIMDWFKAVVVAEGVPDELLKPCTPEQRWAKPEKWAVKKGKQKRALRVLGSEDEAQSYIDRYPENEKKQLWIEHRLGEDTKCDGYCDVRRWCPYYQSKVNADF